MANGANAGDRIQTISVQLEDETAILVEVTQTGREDVANEDSKFKAVTDALGGIVQAIATLINRGNPNSPKFSFPKINADLKEMQEILGNKLSYK